MLVLDSLIKSLQPIMLKKSNELIFLRVFLKWFLSEVLRFYEASVLSNNLKKKNFKPHIPKNYKYLSAIYHDAELEVDLFLKNKNGPPFGKKVPFFLKKVLKELKWNNFDISVFTNYNNKAKVDEVLCIEPSSLTIRHAREKNMVARYSSFTEWFDKIPEIKILEKNKKNNFVNSIILNLIAKSFEDNHIKFTKSAYNYFHDWLNQAANFLNYYMNAPFSKSKNIPKAVWFGSGCSTIWHVILIEKLKKFGTRIVTHDHGGGSAYGSQIQAHLTEYLNTDCFVTHNQFNCEIRAKKINKKYLFGVPPPEIRSIRKSSSSDNRRYFHNSTIVKKNLPIKKIMYVPTAFHGDTTRLRPIFHDVTYFDWQIRLLSFFKKKSIELIYKPHPEGKTKPPEKFSQYFGFETNNSLFENINDEFDIYLVDFVFSSTTPLIFKSNKPIIFINLGFPEILPDAKKLIKKRCYYLEASYDKSSRLSVDFNLLERILENKNHVFDMTFPNLYFKNI
jgi:hypothetical protein